jgi:hypothetical protein
MHTGRPNSRLSREYGIKKHQHAQPKPAPKPPSSQPTPTPEAPATISGISAILTAMAPINPIFGIAGQAYGAYEVAKQGYEMFNTARSGVNSIKNMMFGGENKDEKDEANGEHSAARPNKNALDYVNPRLKIKPEMLPSINEIRKQHIGLDLDYANQHQSYEPLKNLCDCEEDELYEGRMENVNSYDMSMETMGSNLDVSEPFLKTLIDEQTFQAFGIKHNREEIARALNLFFKDYKNMIQVIQFEERLHKLVEELHSIPGDWKTNSETLSLLLQSIVTLFRDVKMLPELHKIFENATHDESEDQPQDYQLAIVKEQAKLNSPIELLTNILDHWDLWEQDQLDKYKFELALEYMNSLKLARENDLITDELYIAEIEKFYEETLMSLFKSPLDENSEMTRRRMVLATEQFSKQFSHDSDEKTNTNVEAFKGLVSRLKTDLYPAHKNISAAKTVHSVIDQVQDGVRGGSLDIEQAYRRLNSLGFKHHTKLDPKGGGLNGSEPKKNNKPEAKEENKEKDNGDSFSFSGVSLDNDQLSKAGYSVVELKDNAYTSSKKFKSDLLQSIKSIKNSKEMKPIFNSDAKDINKLSIQDKLNTLQHLQDAMKNKSVVQHFKFTDLFHHFGPGKDLKAIDTSNPKVSKSLTQDIVIMRNILSQMDNWAKNSKTSNTKSRGGTLDMKNKPPSKLDQWNESRQKNPTPPSSIKTTQFAKYSNHPTKEYVESGKLEYKDATEFNVKTDTDLARMKHEVESQGLTLYIIDFRTGRLFPVQPNDAFRGASYIAKPSHASGGSFAFNTVKDSIFRDEKDLMPYYHLRGEHNKIFQNYHKLASKKHSWDYRDQVTNETGAGLWKWAKKKVNKAANDLVNGVKDAAHSLTQNTADEFQSLKKREITNAKHLSQSATKLYRNPSWKNLGRTGKYGAQLLVQPSISAARQVANISDAVEYIPGMSAVKMGLDYAVPPFGVVDHLAKAIQQSGIGSNQKADYLKALTNLGDSVLSTNKLSGPIDTAARVLNTTGKIADIIHDNK